MLQKKRKRTFRQFNLVKAFFYCTVFSISKSLHFLTLSFQVLSFKLKLIVFPSGKNSFLKEQIQNTFGAHFLTLREKS